jgi:ATP-dependent Clp protease adaptor protein ClpS
MDDYKADTLEETDLQIENDVREPDMYKVLLHNDDYTTMEFVIEVLMGVFSKKYQDATRIMFDVHRKGVGVCGVYTFEVAETKVETVHALAAENGFPLRCTMEA